MSFVLERAAELALRAHALEAFPEECCGIVVEGVYEPCANVAADRASNFRIAGAEVVARTAGRRLQAVAHSHPTANAAPSANDMRAQMASRVPFVIVPTNGETTGAIVTWGDGVEAAPLVGRTFMHGVADCYTAVRDIYRLGRAGAAAQGFAEWPFEPVLLDEFPRDDGWWGEGGDPGQDLYARNFASQGFAPVAREEVAPGDLFLCKIRSDQFNHAGVYVGESLIFHHLPGRLSRREPAGIWARTAQLWIRRTGKGAP